MKNSIFDIKGLMEKIEADSNTWGNPMEMKLCEDKMCFGTPDDIAKLIVAGYGSLMRRVLVIIKAGDNEIAVKMVQLLANKNGCALHKDGKCLLDGTDLIPIEGKLHKAASGGIARFFIENSKVKELLFHRILMEWDVREDDEEVKFCFRKVEEQQGF